MIVGYRVRGCAPKDKFGRDRREVDEDKCMGKEALDLSPVKNPDVIDEIDRSITFNADCARKVNHEILYVTERCVFTLDSAGLILKEIAPGIDVDKDILSRMEFKPEIADDLHEMDPHIFREASMEIREEVMSKKR